MRPQRLCGACRPDAQASLLRDLAPPEPISAASSVASARVDLCFLALGAASDVTFNSVVMSVAYLRSRFGAGVLTLVGRAQFAGSAVTMLLLLALGSRQLVSRSGWIGVQCRAMLVAMAYMLVFMVVLLVSILRDSHLSSGTLFALVLLNGAATGAAQSLGGFLAGLMTKFGGHAAAAAAQMSGVGLGVALPTSAQLLLLPLEALGPARAAVISYGLAVVVLAVGLLALPLLARSESFRRCERGGLDALAGHDGLTAVVAPKLSWWIRTRARQLMIPCCGLLLNFAATVYCGLLTPRLPAEGSLPSAEKLPTLLLGITNVFDFVGRMFAHRALRSHASGLAVPILGMLVLSRLVVAVIVVAYCVYGAPTWTAGSNAFILCVYCVAAILAGVATVSLTHQAQSTCMRTSGFNMDEYSPLPCPIAAQMMFLACILGATFGAALPPP